MTSLSDKDLIDDLNNVAKSLHQNHVTTTQYNTYGKYSSITFIRRFQNWNAAHLAAGLEINPSLDISEDDLKNDIIKVYEENGQHITNRSYSKFGKYCPSVATRIYGSWNKCLEACNININQLKPFLNYTPTILLKIIRDFTDQKGYPPNPWSGRTNDNFPADGTFYRHFPNLNWAEILKLADIEYYNGRKRQANDGRYYDSQQEADLANILVRYNITFDCQVKICPDRLWTCDFYIPSQDLYIEYDGFGDLRPTLEKFEEKLKYYNDNNLKLWIVEKNYHKEAFDRIVASNFINIDSYFMDIAKKEAKKSVCNRAKHGSVVIDKFNRILAAGYNQPPETLPTCQDDGCLILERRKGYFSCFRTLHAEMVVLSHLHKKQKYLKSSKMYITGTCCAVCLEYILKYGIRDIICGAKYGNAEEDIEKEKMLKAFNARITYLEN